LLLKHFSPLPFISKIKTKRKRKKREIYKESIILKYIKAKRSKLKAIKIYII
jgi:hypothetical protein